MAMPDPRPERRRQHEPDREPDLTALEELRKAFGGEARAGAAEGGPYEFEIVEQEPLLTGPPDAALDEDADEGPDEAPDVVPDVGPDMAPEAARSRPATVLDESVPTQAATQPSLIRIDDLASAIEVDGTPPPAPAARHVISIDADDLPDAVYVEGSLESGGSGSIVFIDDDVAADALTPESDRDLRRGIEPRMRERRVAVKRAQGRKRLKWAAALAAIVLVGVGGLATVGSSLFAIRADQLTVTGNVYTDPERLQAVVDDLVGTPVLVADTQRAERELEAIPWVDDAKVTTDFPHAAAIEIRERRPIATYQGPDGRFRVLDREGRVLDVLEKYPFAYVLIEGPDPIDLDPADFAPQGYQAAAELAKNLTGSVRGRVDHIEVTADGSRLSMLLDDGSEVRFGEARDLFAKLVRLETVLTLNPDREPGPIDVSTDQTTL